CVGRVALRRDRRRVFQNRLFGFCSPTSMITGGSMFIFIRPATPVARERDPTGSKLSFHILDLFADLFQLGLAVDDNAGDLSVVCFCAKRIQFPANLLADELERSPDGLRLVGSLDELV